MSSILVVENLEKEYRLGNIEVDALCGVDLEIRAGEFVAIIGPSGSGKSTLLNLFSALDRPSAGTIRFEDVDLANLNDKQLSVLRRKIGIVFQFFNLIGRFNARENVELPMMIMNMSRRERTERALELLEIVGLGDRVDHKPSELSGGERQRIAIGRAVLTDPEFIVCDEPVSSLDVTIQLQILSLLKSIQKEFSVTYLFISHDLRVVRFMCDNVAVMQYGKIVEEGSSHKIYNNPQHPYTKTLLASIIDIYPHLV